MSRQVILKSAVEGSVSVNYPQYGVNRKWNKIGQPMSMPYEVVEQCLWENGFRRMIESGILYIENMQDKIDLGLEPYDATEPTNIIVFNENEMKELWKTATLDEFKEKVLSAPRTQVDSLITYAIKNEIVEMDKVNFIKKLTGKDVLASVTLKRDVEEAEEREAREAAKKGS